MMRYRWIAVLSTSVAACGGSNAVAPTPQDLIGVWHGTFVMSSGQAWTLSIPFNVALSDSLFGDCRSTSHDSCFTKGRVSGDSVYFAQQPPEDSRILFAGQFSGGVLRGTVHFEGCPVPGCDYPLALSR